MRKVDALIGSAVFLLAAPGTVGVLVPWLMTQWARESAGYSWVAAPGLLLIALGAAGLLETFLRFALTGEGTPAPVAPTRRLVVSGLYRHVRNPMYVCVLGLILGQALLLESASCRLYDGRMARLPRLRGVFRGAPPRARIRRRVRGLPPARAAMDSAADAVASGGERLSARPSAPAPPCVPARSSRRPCRTIPDSGRTSPRKSRRPASATSAR